MCNVSRFFFTFTESASWLSNILMGGAVGIVSRLGYIGAAPRGDTGLEKLCAICKITI